MKITLTKRQSRNRMVCTRADGSHAISDLGPSLPYHDLAHYIVESTLQLQRGFFGHVALGYTPEQLGKKEVIVTLPAESWFAEVLARALGSLQTGACTVEQFPQLVNEEMRRFKHDEAKTPTSAVAAQLLQDYQALLGRWNSLGEGAALELAFPA